MKLLPTPVTIFAILMAPVALRAQSLVPCPTVPAHGGDLTQEAPPNSQPARCFFCAKVRKYMADGFTIPGCHAGNPCPFVWKDASGYAVCGNLIDPGGSGNGVLTTALESAEIRGWIVHIGGYHPGEDEFDMDIMVDVGWQPTSSYTHPINTAERLAQYLPPANITDLGWKANYPVRPPVTPSTGISVLGNDAATFGGVYSPVIHIEIDGWGPGRGCNDYELSRELPCPNSQWTADNHPVNWIPYTESTGTVWWPFNPRAFVLNQYVRVVGTLWRDSDHSTSFSGGQNDHVTCWEHYFPNIGWQEMHGVDLIEPAPPPDYAHQHYLAAYSMCMYAFNQQASINDNFVVGLYGPAPRPPIVTSRHVAGFIHYPSLDLPWRNDPNGSRVSLRQRVDGNGITYIAQYQVSATASPVSFLAELVDAYWNNCSAGYCPDPSQGGACVATGLSDVENCGACANQCASPLNGNGGPACVAGRCSFNCAAGYCPSSVDCVQTNLAGDLNNCGSCRNVCNSPTNGWATCSAGQCGIGCNAGYMACGNQCIVCNSPTNGWAVCTNSQCSTGCNAGYTACGGQCVNLQTDRYNCGACGYSCSLSQICDMASCTCSSTKSCQPNYYWDPDICRCSP